VYLPTETGARLSVVVSSLARPRERRGEKQRTCRRIRSNILAVVPTDPIVHLVGGIHVRGHVCSVEVRNAEQHGTVGPDLPVERVPFRSSFDRPAGSFFGRNLVCGERRP